jgi:demethylmenaquinone methyltransferase / 2-methoxy-6-polyprenyl-1,4-benzoquinol methylase
MPRIAGKPIDSTDALRQYYDTRYKQLPIGDEEKHYSWMLKLVEPTPGAHLLDVACGQGALLKLAAAAGMQIAGIDVSPVAVEKAREACPYGSIVVGDAEHLPWPDQTFDYVFNRGSLEHFVDPAQGAREMARVLKPSGKACVMLPNAFWLYEILHTLRTGYGRGVDQVLERFGAVNDWRDFLQDNGLLVEATLRFDGKMFSWKQAIVKYFTPFRLAYHFVYICSRA